MSKESNSSHRYLLRPQQSAESPVERILSASNSRDCDPKWNGKGGSAKCPANEDHCASLSLSDGGERVNRRGRRVQVRSLSIYVSNAAIVRISASAQGANDEQ